jgi:cysteine-rich repeat protein
MTYRRETHPGRLAILFLFLLGGACAKDPPDRQAGADASDGGETGTDGNRLEIPMIITVACSDGVVGPGEQCDDRNRSDGDGCTWNCQIEQICSAVSATCAVPQCGNGLLQSFEACDDGNTTGGDGCAADCGAVEQGWRCRVPGRRCAPVCGDSLIRGDERCDDGNVEDGDGCSATCLADPSRCGDLQVQGAEECDDGDAGNSGAYGGCTGRCTFSAFCGDGVVNGPEECDLGPGNGKTYGRGECTFDCLRAGYCGDGLIQQGHNEQCDQGPDNGGALRVCSDNCLVYL